MNTLPSVTISGASSFTGTWLCRGFAQEGWQVNGLCSGALKHEYAGLKRRRIEFASQVAQLEFGVNAESENMQNWIETHPAQIWIHHHHWMQNFRSPDYDTSKAVEVGIKPLRQICRALKKSGYRAIIFSGSYFEPGEGGHFETGKETPYAKSKKAVWHALNQEAYAQGLMISKVVIPDPVGPLENEDRVIPLMVNKALKNTDFQLRNGEAVADHLPVDALVKTYTQVAKLLINDETTIARPSGLICTNRQWVKMINDELITKGLNLPPIEFEPPTVTASASAPIEPVPSPPKTQTPAAGSFVNPVNEKCDVHWTSFWANYATWVKSGVPWSL